MVVQKTVDNLKGKPPEQKTAVAGGAASLVVIILLIFWVMHFMKQIRSGAHDVSLDGIQNQINLKEVQSANRDIEAQFAKERLQEFQQLRDSAAAQEAGTTNLEVMQVETGGGANEFNRGLGQ